MKNQFNNKIKINGTEYYFHDSVEKRLLKEVETELKQPLKLFNGIYGKLKNQREKRKRNVINAIIKAKTENKNCREITVKMNNNNIKLKDILNK